LACFISFPRKLFKTRRISYSGCVDLRCACLRRVLGIVLNPIGYSSGKSAWGNLWRTTFRSSTRQLRARVLCRWVESRCLKGRHSPLANPLKFMWVILKIGYQKKWWWIIRFSLLHGHKLKVTFPMFRYDLILNILRYILSSYISYIILPRSILIPIISY
jgi:hypothetical protein